ncbi:phosphoribosyltransferase [Edaphovirga cremea]|uniref:phosphoribosyltransferase n=1 Tax=Edaphovirga cremea TaxID=2267246 RepID=UPI00398A4108
MLLDDSLTQGGTFAALASHIEAGGGRVVGAVALTEKQYTAKFSPSPETLQALREKHGDIESDFLAATGHDFDALIESETRYISNF